MSNSRLYNSWRRMRERCSPEYRDSHLYHDRGIKVCDEWQDFQVFMEWALANGYEEGLTIDRKDNDKGYQPDNCRWLTRANQNRNRRLCIYLEHDGKTLCLAEWCEVYGINKETARKRYHRGLDFPGIFGIKGQ